MPSFQRRLVELLKDLKTKEWEEIPWFEDFSKTLKVEKEILPELVAEFMAELETVNPEELVVDGSEIRTEMLLDSIPPSVFPVSFMMCTYTIKWQDGTLVDYICKPFGLEQVLPTDMLAKLSQLFAEQFIESLVHPGLDLFHNKSAKKFDNDKFKKLVEVMYDYVNSLDAQQREPYEDIIKRLRHRMTIDMELEVPVKPTLQVLENGGGFS